MSPQDHKNTLNLPKTAFPMKAKLPQREPEVLKRWEEDGLYQKIRASRKGKPKYILHDGPPYANGNVHVGTALNKVLKDIVVRYKTLTGYDAPFVPGWDCHGLPIEHQVMKELGARAKTLKQIEIRKRCRQFAEKFIDVQREQFKRLGVSGDWDRPYLTLDPAYEAGIADLFHELVRKGFVYRASKPIHWCPQCETALAEAELEYKEHASPSIYVRFPVEDEASRSNWGGHPKETKISFLAWTTTPWTLPGNVAIALHPKLEYHLGKFGDEYLIATKTFLTGIGQEMGIQYLGPAGQLGKGLEGGLCRHPFLDRDSQIVLADYVSAEEGTGCVHTAPGHGQEDYLTGLKYKLDVLSPVDAKGRFTDEGGVFKGQNVFDANSKVIELLQERGMLFGEPKKIKHSYPHCWRCKGPVIFRSTRQWFISVDKGGLREKALKMIRKVKWVPGWGISRIGGMIEVRPDWCVSRQRAWGVPIPVLLCKKCDEPILDEKVLRQIRDRIARDGTDVWFEEEASGLATGVRCKHCGSDEVEKEMDILDVWFESGASHRSVLKTRADLSFPADLYLEGSDQHRGWFQSSLLTAMGTEGTAPYRAVLTHGFMVDAKGRKMSKSLGNLINAQEMVEERGADVVRLWIASENSQNDVTYSAEIASRMAEAYRRIRNTFRYGLANLYDFDPGRDRVDDKDLLEIDRWLLTSLESVKRDVKEAYESFQFHKIYSVVHGFCTVTLSSFYLDVQKDCLYTLAAGSRERRSAQTALFEVVRVLTILVAPILPFTSEEVWGGMPGKREVQSVHLADWPKACPERQEKPLLEEWKELLKVRNSVLSVLERRREAKEIGTSLEAEVVLYVKDPKLLSLLKAKQHLLETLFIVSGAPVEGCKDFPQGVEAVDGLESVAIVACLAKGKKCSRCWRYQTSVGQDGEHPALCARCLGVIAARAV